MSLYLHSNGILKYKSMSICEFFFSFWLKIDCDPGRGEGAGIFLAPMYLYVGTWVLD